MKNMNENGRSMIEMLGVLAIIGVLSVGGIMGYSKAMFRYKINKAIDQITYIAGSVRATFANQGNYQGVEGVMDSGRWDRSIWKKARILPDDMQINRSTGSFISILDFGGEIYCATKNSADTQCKAFQIEVTFIPEEACIELVTHDWKNAQAKMIRVVKKLTDFHFYDYGFYFIPPAKLDDAIKLCDTPSNDRNGVDVIVFFFEVDTSDSYWKDKIDATTATLSGS